MAELSIPKLDLDWSDDSLFYTHTWSDETSQFDDHPSKRWCPGLECYERTYKARVPIALRNCDEAIEWFIAWASLLERI